MRHPFSGTALFVLATVAFSAVARDAHAQACCAGTGAVTPGRLANHETALAGVSLRNASVFGSYDANANYVAAPPGTTELDFEQDLFGAYRFLKHGQVALLVPIVETSRKSQGRGESGGGIGDVNLSGRWDFTLSGASTYIPGIAVLAGVTAPTGTPPDAKNIGDLATGATGIGAWQLNAGLALEQNWGPWLVTLSGILAQRTARTVDFGATQIHERLGPQWTALGAVAYSFPSEVAVALSASYTIEENATISGQTASGTAHRLPLLTLANVLPIGDSYRVQNALFFNLPVSELGLNQPANAGFTLTVIRSWM